MGIQNKEITGIVVCSFKETVHVQKIFPALRAGSGAVFPAGGAPVRARLEVHWEFGMCAGLTHDFSFGRSPQKVNAPKTRLLKHA